MRSTALLTAVLLGSLAGAPAAAAAARYVVAPGGGTEVVFTSKAPLETFQGRTNRVTGWLEFDPEDLSAPLSFAVEVDLASFDTGNRKRNGHMRDNHLETDTFPTAWFRGGTVVACAFGRLEPGAEVAARVAGELDLHGVVQPLECDAVLVRAADGLVTVRAEFTVSLAAHGIERPSFLVMKLADEQAVRVTLEALPEAAP